MVPNAPQVPLPFMLNIYWFGMLSRKALKMAKGGCAAHASQSRALGAVASSTPNARTTCIAHTPRAHAARACGMCRPFSIVRRHAVGRDGKGKGEAKPTKAE